MSTKSGYSRIVAMMQRQGSNQSSGGLVLAEMKSKTTLAYNGMTLEKDKDYKVLESPWKHKHSATSSDGANITIENNDSKKYVNDLEKGDTVLLYDTDGGYILLGKVV